MATLNSGILFYDPRNKPTSIQNVFQPGCYRFFYLTQTTTETNVYSDAKLTTPLSQPVFSASDGRFPQIYMDPTVVYRVQLYNSVGMLLDDTDPYVVPGSISSFTQATLGALLWPQTAAEAAASVVPTNFQDLPNNAPFGDVKRYGAALDGVTDDTAAMLQAVSVAGEIVISGPMALASATLAALPNNAINLKSNTRIRFIENGSITITGSTPCNLFYSTDQANIELIDPVIKGNGVGTTTTGYCWYIKASAALAANLLNFRISGGVIQNFSGLYWIYVDNTAGTTYYMQNIKIDGTAFYSFAGNAQGPTNIQVTAAIFGASGSDSVSYYGIRDIQITRCQADGTFIKTFAIGWNGTYRMSVSNNQLHNFAQDSSFTDDTGAYICLFYDHSHGAVTTVPDMIMVANNTFDTMRDAGIYCAVVNRIFIQGNIFRGQTSSADTVIPKGAIALNQPTFAMVKDNNIHDSARGVAAVLATGNAVHITSLTVTTGALNNYGIKASPTGTGQVGDIVIEGYKYGTSASGSSGIRIDSDSTIGFANVAIRDFKIDATLNGIFLNSVDSSIPNLGTVHISNGEIGKFTNYGLLWNNASNAATRITIENIKFQQPTAGSGMIHVGSSTGLTVRNLTFEDMASGGGFAWTAPSANGTVEGLRYRNVAIANRYSGASDMGTVLPTWTGNDNDFVMDLNPTELGSTSSKYTRQGWVWDRVAAAWKEVRALTGN